MMRARALERLRSLPVRATSIWETLPDVRQTLMQLKTTGSFRMAAMLADELWADDRFAGVLSTRTDALVSAPMLFSPADDSPKARKVLDALGISDDDPDGIWDDMIPDSVAEDATVGANVLNMGLAKIEWDVVDGMQMPRATTMHAQFLRWDQQRRAYLFMTENMGEVELPHLDQNPHGDGNWLILTPFGWDNWRRCMLHWMGPLLIYRRWDLVDWANYNEVYGKPTKVGYVPAGAKEDEIEAFIAELHNAGANATVKVPRPATAQDGAGAEVGYGVGLIEARSRGWDTFEGFNAFVDKAIAIGYLGVDLLTDSGGGGSLALSKMQEPRFLNRVGKDAKHRDKAMRAQLLWHWAERNFGDGRLAPRITSQVQPPESEVEEGSGYEKLGLGVKAMQDAGMDVDVYEIRDAHGIPGKDPGDEVAGDEPATDENGNPIEGAATAEGGGAGGGAGSRGPALTTTAVGAIITVNEARASIGYGPLKTDAGGDDPDGSLTVAEYTAKHAAVVATASKAEDGQHGPGVTDKPEPPPAFGKAAAPDAADAAKVPKIPPALAKKTKGELAVLDNLRVLEMAGALRRGAALQARYIPVPPVRRYTFAGLPIAVENPKGTTRVWREEGSADVIGQTLMRHDYGYIEGVMGSDKEELDAYVGPDEDAPDVHVVHQLRAPDFKAHDEDKVMLGFKSADAAKAAYLAHRNDGDRAFGTMSVIPLDRFKARLQRRGPATTSKIHAGAGARPAGPAAPKAIAMLERAAHLKGAAATPTAKRRAKLYGDRVADKAIALAAAALGPDVADVRRIIAGCTSLEELRPKLAEHFKGMDPARLTELVYRARVMARIGGAAAAVKRL